MDKDILRELAKYIVSDDITKYAHLYEDLPYRNCPVDDMPYDSIEPIEFCCDDHNVLREKVRESYPNICDLVFRMGFNSKHIYTSFATYIGTFYKLNWFIPETHTHRHYKLYTTLGIFGPQFGRDICKHYESNILDIIKDCEN